MTVVFRRPDPDEFEQLARFDGRAFGSDWKPDDLERTKPVMPFHRFWIGEDARPDGSAEIVVAGGAYEKDLTLPGGTAVPMAGITWVAVAVTHRRQGLLRELMGRLAGDAAEHDEPLLGLTASEGSIYERFGYGIATRNRIVSIDRRLAQVRPEFQPAPGSVRLAPREGVEAELLERWNRYRPTQPGELSRDEAWFTQRIGNAERTTFALHDDGFAVWTIEQHWNHGHAAHELDLTDFCAVTPEAHAALWHTILSVDLVGPVFSYDSVALDDALPYLLTNPRALRTTDLNDFLWLTVRDPATAFSSRTYRTDDRIVLGTELGSFAVTNDECSPTTDEPDLVCSPSALGPLLLGGVSASELARGRRLTADPAVLSRADAFFQSDPLPHCRTPF